MSLYDSVELSRKDIETLFEDYFHLMVKKAEWHATFGVSKHPIYKVSSAINVLAETLKTSLDVMVGEKPKLNPGVEGGLLSAGAYIFECILACEEYRLFVIRNQGGAE